VSFRSVRRLLLEPDVVLKLTAGCVMNRSPCGWLWLCVCCACPTLCGTVLFVCPCGDLVPCFFCFETIADAACGVAPPITAPLVLAVSNTNVTLCQ
jgi:hypothetical protein